MYFVGLGLGDAKDITVKGLEVVKKCKRVYLEAYTSILTVGKDALVWILILNVKTFFSFTDILIFLNKWHSKFSPKHFKMFYDLIYLFDVKMNVIEQFRCIWRHNFTYLMNNIIILTSCTNLWHNSFNRLPNYIKFHMLEIQRNCYSRLKLLFYVKNWHLIPI